MPNHVIEELAGFYRIIELKMFRRTEGVKFDMFPMEFLPRIDGIDRVMHASDALSPGTVGDVKRPWYMHPEQEDNLLVLQGTRTVDIYTLERRQLLTFVVEPDRVLRDGKVIYDGPAILVWPMKVFHRITSGADGSASLNFAVRMPGINMKTNFNVYDLDTKDNTYKLIRAGHLDQNPA